jgi:hypothetical protein
MLTAISDGFRYLLGMVNQKKAYIGPHYLSVYQRPPAEI